MNAKTNTLTIGGAYAPENPSRINPFIGWEWLKTPAILLMLVGGAGVLRAHVETLGHLLAFLKFPPVWSCGVMLAGGLILLWVAATACRYRKKMYLPAEKRNTWRSL